MEADIRVVTSADEITAKDHAFSVVDVVSEKRPSAIASTNGIGGMSIKMSKETADKTILGENKRTVAHEVGHSAGLTHTNEKTYKNSNLMTQMRYVSRGIDSNSAININLFQVNQMQKAYRGGLLNRRSPLVPVFNATFKNQWPFINIKTAGYRLNL